MGFGFNLGLIMLMSYPAETFLKPSEDLPPPEELRRNSLLSRSEWTFWEPARVLRWVQGLGFMLFGEFSMPERLYPLQPT